MNHFSLIKQLYYGFFGSIYFIVYWTDTHHLVGLRIASLIKIFAFFLPVLALISRWGTWPILTLFILFFIIQFGYWRTRKRGYYRFVRNRSPIPSPQGTPSLAPNKRITILATGTFSVIDDEKNLLFHPGKYWQVPLGEHGVMVEHQPGRFLYQFFNANTLKNIQCGWLIFGRQPKSALAITFLSSWGPEFNEINYDLFGRQKQKPVKKIREIYFSFPSKEEERIVLNNLINDFPRP